MPARTGREFLKGLSKPREIWVGDDKVRDVVSHPAFAGAAHTLAEVFDLQHQARDVCLMPDPETGEPINVSHMIPRSREDLERRHACLQTHRRIHRRPDGPHARLHERHLRGLRRARRRVGDQRQRGAARRTWSRTRSSSRRNDISLTHTIVQPTIDKAPGDAPAPATKCRCTRSATPSTASSCAARASWRRSRRSPTRSRSIPALPLPEGADAYALSFCIPMDTPGLKFLCRDSCATPPQRFDHPLSSRFDEQDAFVIFDDVEVPRDRVFIDGNLAAYNTVMADRLVAEHHAADDDPRADEARVRLGPGACAMAEAINDVDRRRRSRCSARSGRYAELDARRDSQPPRPRRSSAATACGSPTAARSPHCARTLPTWFPRVNEIITLIGSHNLLASADRGAARRSRPAAADRPVPARRQAT